MTTADDRPDQPVHDAIYWQLSPPGESPDDARSARFQWKNGESVIEQQDFTRQDLEAQIDQLEAAGDDVPVEFREALAAFDEGS